MFVSGSKSAYEFGAKLFVNGKASPDLFVVATS